MYEFQIYRGVRCHENVELFNIWGGIGLSFQHWHEEFWSELLKVSEIWTLMDFFRPNCVIFALKNYRRVLLDSAEFYRIVVVKKFQVKHGQSDSIIYIPQNIFFLKALSN